MAPKRPMGLGKAAKAKKQKKEEEQTTTKEIIEDAPSNEIRVELSEAADADDEVAQLQALWNTYQMSEKDNELVLNGIVHECDRLLRNSATNSEAEDDSKQALPDYFHSIYALALADLAIFNTEGKEASKTVKDFFESGLERIDLGFEKYPESIDLSFSKSRIILNRIPLEYISQMTVESTTKDFPKLSVLLDEALDSYELAEERADDQSQYDLFNEDNFEILEALDDLLDIVDNFGQDHNGEDLDSDQEDYEIEEVQLAKNHPFYGIKETDKYNQWWRDHIIIFLAKLDKRIGRYTLIDEVDDKLANLRREICKRIGQSYLAESEGPASIFTTLEYDSDNEEEEIQGLNAKDAQKIAVDLVSTAIGYLGMSEDPEVPQSWVDIAEAKITLGNLYENESKEQEKIYRSAENILVKANNATNGKYDHILQNLLRGSD